MIENPTTWLKGNHNISFGVTMVVRLMCGCRTRRWCRPPSSACWRRKPADGIFNATTLPGASAADITQAKNLYAMLTGRITSLAGDARINPAGDQYVPLGLSRAEGRMREFNFFVADSWRVEPDRDLERRPALRAARSVLSREQQLHDGD